MRGELDPELDEEVDDRVVEVVVKEEEDPPETELEAEAPSTMMLMAWEALFPSASVALIRTGYRPPARSAFPMINPKSSISRALGNPMAVNLMGLAPP